MLTDFDQVKSPCSELISGPKSPTFAKGGWGDFQVNHRPDHRNNLAKNTRQNKPGLK